MAKKLVFDRAINVHVIPSRELRVPRDELWKVTAARDLKIGGVGSFSKNTSHLIGQSSSVAADDNLGCLLTGIAFKMVEV
ncbi:MAG: hypothetical protein ACLUOC_03645 [Peptoniphilaceae bacterium]